jgi:lysophospholipase L1-like esterase
VSIARLSLCGVIAIAAVMPHAAGAAEAGWQGAFAHAPTAYNLSPPTIISGRDGNPRSVPPGYAPTPAYKAASTVREIIRLSVAARAIRVRLSNEFSDKPMHIGEVHVALASENGAILPGSDHQLTFSGAHDAIIPPGAPLLSDGIAWTVPPLAKLAVTVFYPDETLPPAHTLYALDAWSADGNQAGAPNLVGALPARNGNHLSEVDVLPQQGGHAVVCFGDSITEGVASTAGQFRGWCDRLADRLQANPATRGWSVVNTGIGSNRLLHDTPSTNALSRLDRDVFSVPGVTKIVILLGINDIQYSRRNPAEAVTADDIIAALRQLVLRSHAKDIAVIGGTITAFAGSSSYSPEGEAMRLKVNEWIRSGGIFDGVVDFDRATRDPVDPTRLQAAADSGGHLHPNDAGYALMGDAIDLALFEQQSRAIPSAGLAP